VGSTIKLIASTFFKSEKGGGNLSRTRFNHMPNETHFELANLHFDKPNVIPAWSKAFKTFSK
jgi:hypothetical protein